MQFNISRMRWRSWGIAVQLLQLWLWKFVEFKYPSLAGTLLGMFYESLKPKLSIEELLRIIVSNGYDTCNSAMIETL